MKNTAATETPAITITRDDAGNRFIVSRPTSWGTKSINVSGPHKGNNGKAFYEVIRGGRYGKVLTRTECPVDALAAAKAALLK